MNAPSRYATLCRSLLAAVLCGLLASGLPHARAQRPVGLAFYDADRLYDTLPARFYDDTDYTPQGRLRWNGERYRRKIERTAALVDSLALPLVALWGVENETVVRDISASCRGDYTYLHRTLNSLDGLDFALLYHGDRFFPERVDEGRRCLIVEGTLDDKAVCLILSTDDRAARWAVADLREERPASKLLVLGCSDGVDAEAFGLRDAQADAARAGRGSTFVRGRWTMRHRILVDTAFRIRSGDVYARRFLIDPTNGTPLPTYSGRSYRGGCGRHLPVFVYIE